MRIAVVYSLPVDSSSQERTADEDTRDSAIEVVAALEHHGVDVELVPVSLADISRLKKVDVDCVFNLIEWTGRYLPSTIEAIKILEKSGLPFTGASADNFLLTSDKVAAKEVLARLGYPTAPWVKFERGDEKIPGNFPFPALVKLSREHCSVSLDETSMVANESEAREVIVGRLRDFGQGMYLEAFLSGREFHATVVERQGEIIVLPLAEIVYKDPASYNFLTFAGRWHETDPSFQATSVKVAEVTTSLDQAIRKASLGVFKDLEFRGYARFDIRLDTHGQFYFLEVNSNPGLTDSEDYTMTVSYKAAGLTFNEVVWLIVDGALRRFATSGRYWLSS